jgi:hypothetical protein
LLYKEIAQKSLRKKSEKTKKTHKNSGKNENSPESFRTLQIAFNTPRISQKQGNSGRIARYPSPNQ